MLKRHDNSIYLDVNSPTDNDLSKATLKSFTDIEETKSLNSEIKYSSIPVVGDGPVCIPLRLWTPTQSSETLSTTASTHEWNNNKLTDSTAGKTPLSEKIYIKNNKIVPSTAAQRLSGNPTEAQTSAMFPIAVLPAQIGNAVVQVSRGSNNVNPNGANRRSLSQVKTLPKSGLRRITQAARGSADDAYRVWTSTEGPSNMEKFRVTRKDQREETAARKPRYSIVPVEVVSSLKQPRVSHAESVAHKVAGLTPRTERGSIVRKNNYLSGDHPVYYLTPDGQVAQVIQQTDQPPPDCECKRHNGTTGYDDVRGIQAPNNSAMEVKLDQGTNTDLTGQACPRSTHVPQADGRGGRAPKAETPSQRCTQCECSDGGGKSETWVTPETYNREREKSDLHHASGDFQQSFTFQGMPSYQLDGLSKPTQADASSYRESRALSQKPSRENRRPISKDFNQQPANDQGNPDKVCRCLMKKPTPTDASKADLRQDDLARGFSRGGNEFPSVTATPFASKTTNYSNQDFPGEYKQYTQAVSKAPCKENRRPFSEELRAGSNDQEKEGQVCFCIDKERNVTDAGMADLRRDEAAKVYSRDTSRHQSVTATPGPTKVSDYDRQGYGWETKSRPTERDSRERPASDVTETKWQNSQLSKDFESASRDDHEQYFYRGSSRYPTETATPFPSKATVYENLPPTRLTERALREHQVQELKKVLADNTSYNPMPYLRQPPEIQKTDSRESEPAPWMRDSSRDIHPNDSAIFSSRRKSFHPSTEFSFFTTHEENEDSVERKRRGGSQKRTFREDRHSRYSSPYSDIKGNFSGESASKYYPRSSALEYSPRDVGNPDRSDTDMFEGWCRAKYLPKQGRDRGGPDSARDSPKPSGSEASMHRQSSAQNTKVKPSIQLSTKESREIDLGRTADYPRYRLSRHDEDMLSDQGLQTITPSVTATGYERDIGDNEEVCGSEEDIPYTKQPPNKKQREGRVKRKFACTKTVKPGESSSDCNLQEEPETYQNIKEAIEPFEISPRVTETAWDPIEEEPQMVRKPRVHFYREGLVARAKSKVHRVRPDKADAIQESKDTIQDKADQLGWSADVGSEKTTVLSAPSLRSRLKKWSRQVSNTSTAGKDQEQEPGTPMTLPVAEAGADSTPRGPNEQPVPITDRSKSVSFTNRGRQKTSSPSQKELLEKIGPLVKQRRGMLHKRHYHMDTIDDYIADAEDNEMECKMRPRCGHRVEKYRSLTGNNNTLSEQEDMFDKRRRKTKRKDRSQSHSQDPGPDDKGESEEKSVVLSTESYNENQHLTPRASVNRPRSRRSHATVLYRERLHRAPAGGKGGAKGGKPPASPGVDAGADKGKDAKKGKGAGKKSEEPGAKGGTEPDKDAEKKGGGKKSAGGKKSEEILTNVESEKALGKSKSSLGGKKTSEVNEDTDTDIKPDDKARKLSLAKKTSSTGSQKDDKGSKASLVKKTSSTGSQKGEKSKPEEEPPSSPSGPPGKHHVDKNRPLHKTPSNATTPPEAHHVDKNRPLEKTSSSAGPSDVHHVTRNRSAHKAPSSAGETTDTTKGPPSSAAESKTGGKITPKSSALKVTQSPLKLPQDDKSRQGSAKSGGTRTPPGAGSAAGSGATSGAGPGKSASTKSPRGVVPGSPAPIQASPVGFREPPLPLRKQPSRYRQDRVDDMSKPGPGYDERLNPPGVVIFQIAARYATFGGIRVAGGVRVLMDAPDKMGYVQIVSPMGQPFITHYVNTLSFLHSSSAAGVAWSAVVWEPPGDGKNNNKVLKNRGPDNEIPGKVDSSQVVFCEPYQAHRFRAVLETIKAAFSGDDAGLVTPNVPPIPSAGCCFPYNPCNPCIPCVNPCNPCPDPCNPCPTPCNPCPCPDPCNPCSGMATPNDQKQGNPGEGQGQPGSGPCPLPFPPPMFVGTGSNPCCPSTCLPPCASHPNPCHVPPPFCSPGMSVGNQCCPQPCNPCPMPCPTSVPGQCPNPCMNPCPDDCDPYAYTNCYGKTLFCQVACMVKLGRDEVWQEMHRGCLMVIQEPNCMGYSLVLVNDKQVVVAIQKLSRKTDFKNSPHTQHGFLYNAVTTTEKGSLHENFMVSFQCKQHADQFRQVVTGCKRVMMMSSGTFDSSNSNACCPPGTMTTCDAPRTAPDDSNDPYGPPGTPRDPCGVQTFSEAPYPCDYGPCRGGADPCSGGRDYTSRYAGSPGDRANSKRCTCRTMAQDFPGGSRGVDYGKTNYDQGKEPGPGAGYRRLGPTTCHRGAERELASPTFPSRGHRGPGTEGRFGKVGCGGIECVGNAGKMYDPCIQRGWGNAADGATSPGLAMSPGLEEAGTVYSSAGAVYASSKDLREPVDSNKHSDVEGSQGEAPTIEIASDIPVE